MTAQQEQAERQDYLENTIPLPWRENPRFGAALVKLYPTALWPDAAAFGSVPALCELCSAVLDHPVQLVILRLDPQNSMIQIDVRERYETGRRILENRIRQEPLPPGMYLAMLSPIPLRDGGGLNEPIAEDAVRLARGLVTGCLGHAAAHGAIWTAHYKLRELGVSFPTPVIENFIPPDEHDFLEVSAIGELARALETHLPEEMANRIRTAFRILGAAAAVVDPAVRLVNTWIALEVATSSRGKAEDAIFTVAGERGREIAQRIKENRNAFLHKGELVEMSADDERVVKAAIIQCVASFYKKSVLRSGWLNSH